MRDDGCVLGPKPRRDEFLVFGCRKVNEPIDAAPHTRDGARIDMVGEQLRRIPCFIRLTGCKEALLGERNLKETVPTRTTSSHAQNLSKT